MNSIHKKVKVYENVITVSARTNSIKYFEHSVSHIGKTNHKIYGNFSVNQPQGFNDQDIKIYIMTDIQLADWSLNYAGYKPLGETYREIPSPKEYHYSSGRQKKADFDITVVDENHLFFIFDNSFSERRDKSVNIVIWEEWDEIPNMLDLLTTIPPQDRSLSEAVKQIFLSAKQKLKIITPYIDMLLVSDLLDLHQKGITITVITRIKKDFDGKGAKTAFDHIHDALRKNHRTNELIHSRILICDDAVALVSSADLTQDSLIGQFNAGTMLSDVSTIKKLNSYFDQVWQKSLEIK